MQLFILVENIMPDTGRNWTVASLKAALEENGQGSGIRCAAADGADVLEVVLEDSGDFLLHVSVGEEQILSSAILWPRDAQEDPAGFEAMMLRSHKSLLPLCALSIDAIGGREYYELFGAISRQAPLKEILAEFHAIADSALELARDIGPRAINQEDVA
ncbi:hypothetical protein PhaeoP70_00029 [Phaeobacter inhibens]|nr:hypothetical protein PhaeoP92_00029 [Phaeobacter inhibens]AUQ76764.1 hypothetical protein PhaeoP74_00029 [Phaeobacter inhibens]AUR13925.1 hypothetical protein PhaeoP70_00029 [Phaeobacter inhibens]